MSLNRTTARITSDVTDTTVGTTPSAGRAHVLIGMTLCNKGVTEAKARVWLYDGTNDTYVVWDLSCPIGATPVPVGAIQKIVLLPGDLIKVRGDKKLGASLALDVIMTFADEENV